MPEATAAARSGTALGTTERTALTRRALRLAQATVAWNVVEGAVAVAAGLAAGLVSVVGFGLDSGIETAAAVLVALRLAARLRRGTADDDASAAEERRERVTLRLVALTFVALALWVTAAGIRALVGGETPESSPVGLGLLAVSLVVMPVLADAKARVGRRLGDPLVLADAAETRLCALLSASTLAGVGLFQLTGATWLDPVAGFVVAAFALHEAREAWEGELAEDDEHERDTGVGDDAPDEGTSR